jgi:hypothetical protein
MEWGAVSAWVAASIAALSTAWGAWLRARDRPEADWQLLGEGRVTVRETPDFVEFCDRNGGTPMRIDELVNSGDGDAYRVMLVPSACLLGFVVIGDRYTSGFAYGSEVPRIKSGDSVLVVMWDYLPDGHPDKGDPGFALEWLSSPTRHQRYRDTYFRYADYEPGQPLILSRDAQRDPVHRWLIQSVRRSFGIGHPRTRRTAPRIHRRAPAGSDIRSTRSGQGS